MPWRPVLLAIALVAAVLGITPRSYADVPDDEVHYTFSGQTSVAIDWRGTATDVRWGPTSGYGNVTTGVAPQWTPWSSPGPYWQAQIGGLAPGATYHYSIGGGPDFTFHTPPTGSFRFDAIGDIGDTQTFGHLAGTLSAIAADDPSFVLMVGDLTYANSTGSSLSVIDQHFNDVMNSWGTSAAYMPAWGNHEYDVPGSDDLRNYKGRLLMPNAQASPGSPDISCCGDDWGWFDAGPVRFIAYPEPWTGAWADWQSKANTLMAQAQNDPAIRYIITYGHRPAYSTGYHTGEAQLATILDGFGATYNKYVLNINGHSHDYERFQPIQGVTHVTVGAPSSLELPWSSTDPRTAFRAYHLSHLRVDVSDTGLRLQAICDESSSKEDYTCSQGSVMDEYTIGVPPPAPVRTEYYVDKTVAGCADTGPGSGAVPFCTISKGVSLLQPGSTLYVGNGTYAEPVKPTVSGTAGSPITITAWPGRSPVIGTGASDGAYISTRSYIVLSNLTFTGSVGDGVYVTKSDHITITGNAVSGSGRPLQGATANGISIRTTNSSTVQGNVSDHNSGHGFYITNTSTGNVISDNEASYNAYGWERNANGIDVTAPGNVVLRNVTHDNEDSGIQFYTGGDNGLAALNVTYNNGDHGIDDLNVTGGRIISNTVFHNCTSGINVEGTSGNYTVENNIAVDNAVYPAYNGISCSRRAGNIGIWDSAPASTTVDHNLVYLSKAGVMYAYGTTYTSLAAMQNATGQEKHGVQAAPGFLDVAARNFQLTAGSPAVDRGNSALPDAQDHDVLGNPRVDDPDADNSNAEGPRLYDDLGAYEYQPDVAPAPSSPVATIRLTPRSGTAPVQVTADASGSTDPGHLALTYSFDWGDGTASGPQTGATATHTYSGAGTYPVTVTVTKSAGLTDSASDAVVVSPAPVAPTAQLSVSPVSGTAPLPVTADASASTDPQGQALTYDFEWGDGSVSAAQSSPTATHTYTTPGTYTVTTTVTDTAGLTGQATATVAVATPSNPPTAALSVDPASGTAPVQVTADGSGSSDPQGQPLTYAFDWGDGTSTGSQTNAGATHTYTTPGQYTVTLTVTNTDGVSALAGQPVSVTAPPAPPTARLSVSPSTGTTPVDVTADASASTDPQGQTLTYAFDWGDGTSTGSQTNAGATHTYTAAGTYTVKVTVTDTAGLTDTATQTVTVDPPPSPPTARLTVSPTSGTAPVAVTADASASTDPQGQTLTYAFDWSDGTSTGSQTNAGATHTYTAAGTYTVKVTVTDTAGLTDTATQTVTVKPAPGYVGTVATGSSGSSSTTATATVSGPVPTGDLVVVTLQVSSGSKKPYTVTDSAGNVYKAGLSATDRTGAELLTFYAPVTKALTAGDQITAKLPASSSYRMTVDDLTGVSALDRSAVATGQTSTFSSGATKTTTSASELVLGIVGIVGGSQPPGWAAPWQAGDSFAVGSSYLGRAWQAPTRAGSYTATGTATGTWTAVVLTFRP
ncbi:PKD domain-containing protein [Nocardioides sp.]|uniref:PKD domain-containing protein n=1 Tax=Nocardioides sp. TaxID=35761 RepID=UPI002F3EB536